VPTETFPQMQPSLLCAFASFASFALFAVCFSSVARTEQEKGGLQAALYFAVSRPEVNDVLTEKYARRMSTSGPPRNWHGWSLRLRATRPRRSHSCAKQWSRTAAWGAP
jgi:hypothetical protein